MAYVIAEPCVGVCDAACVKVCPVDAIAGPLPVATLRAMEPRERARLQLYIDPESCICCGACAPACPVEAIFEEEDLPHVWAAYRDLNAEFFNAGRAG